MLSGLNLPVDPNPFSHPYSFLFLPCVFAAHQLVNQLTNQLGGSFPFWKKIPCPTYGIVSDPVSLPACVFVTKSSLETRQTCLWSLVKVLKKACSSATGLFPSCISFLWSLQFSPKLHLYLTCRARNTYLSLQMHFDTEDIFSHLFDHMK